MSRPDDFKADLGATRPVATRIVADAALDAADLDWSLDLVDDVLTGIRREALKATPMADRLDRMLRRTTQQNRDDDSENTLSHWPIYCPGWTTVAR